MLRFKTLNLEKISEGNRDFGNCNKMSESEHEVEMKKMGQIKTAIQTYPTNIPFVE